MVKRVAYIDITRGLAILLVVFGHLLWNDNIIKSIIYSFHMPLFFILTGMLYKKTRMCSAIENRFLSTYIPYFIWAMIFAPFSFRNIALVIYGTNEALLNAGSNGMLWFLPTIFFSNIISVSILNYISKYRFNKVYTIVAAIVTMLISTITERFHNAFGGLGFPFSFDVVFLATSFMLVGFLISKYFDNICSKLNNVSKLFFSVLLLAVSFLAITFETDRGYPQMATLDVGIIPIYFAVALFPSFGTIIFAKVIEKTKYLSKCLMWIGENTMSIFILHRTMVYVCRDLYTEYTEHLLIPLFILLMLYCCVGSIIINKFCPWIVGKLKKQ